MTSPTPPSAGEMAERLTPEEKLYILNKMLRARGKSVVEQIGHLMTAAETPLETLAADTIAKLRERVAALEGALREISELDDSRCTTWFDVAHQQIKIAVRALAGEKP